MLKEIAKKLTPDFLLNWYHLFWAFLGAMLYGFPSRQIKVIGVTGTNGKSTVVFLISRILEEANFKVAAISSIEFKIKDKVWRNDLKMTMPGRLKIQQFLRQAVNDNCQYAVLEVTSEGIKQHRHCFIGFDVAVLTNLTPEHLESHGSFENYKKAKGELFKSLKKNGKSVVNSDDPSADYFLSFKAKEKLKYSVKSAKDIQSSLNLLGKFNLANALAAMTVGLSEGVPLEKIKSALEKVKSIPGRLEIVIKEPITVIVDYAHTPDALEKVYQTIRELFSGRLIGVLGAAGGGRDKWKRPAMGQIAEKYLDEIIITNEDPYDEDPSQILSQIESGISKSSVLEILDRREAIRKALSLAQTGDVVIITGKGCEPWMCLANNEKIPWDDREIVKEEFNKLK